MANLNQLKCPSCGAVLSLSIPDQIVVECPYCHQQVINTNAYKSTKGGEEARILEFKLEVKDIIKRLIDNLVSDQTVPRDIFDKMSISSTKQYYVPMYIFEGAFRAPWSAEIPREVKKQRIDYQGKLEDYYETVYDYPSGEVAGNFYINCFSHEELTRLNLNNYDIRLSPTSLPAFSQVSIGKDIVLIASSGDADYVWRECGYAKVLKIAFSEAEYQAQFYLKNCSASCELQKTWMVYIPIWIIKYEYNGKSYTYINYAERVDSGSRPYDNEIEKTDISNIYAQPTTKQQKILDNYNKRNSFLTDIGGFGCLGITLIGFIGCWGLDKYRSAHYLDKDYDYYGHANDSFDFLLNMLYAGIALLVIVTIVKYIYRRINSIDDIEEDIALRTKYLQEDAEDKMNKILYEADKYKRETGNAFLNAFSGVNESNTCDNQQTKTCVHCGKEISVSHMFCRYCGAKQN